MLHKNEPLTDEQAVRMRQLPYYEGDFRAAFTRKQGMAWRKLIAMGYAVVKTVKGKRLYSRTPAGTHAILHYHVEHEMRDMHAEFASPLFAHREPQI